MLKLKYDVKCGFNQIYIVEKDVEYTVAEFDESDEKKIYNELKDNHNLDELLTYFGLNRDLLEDREYYAHEYLSSICKEEHCSPGIFEISNVDLILDNDDPNSKNYINPLRASEVMQILDISRPTLCHYVKRGLITVDRNYTGKQYRYNAKSVYKLLDGNKKH